MDHGGHGAGVALSPAERRALLRIEAELGADRRLARRMRCPASRPALAGPLCAALVCASVVLAVLGIGTAAPVFLWAFAAVWPCALLTAFGLLRRVTLPGRTATTPWL